MNLVRHLKLLVFVIALDDAQDKEMAKGRANVKKSPSVHSKLGALLLRVPGF